ALPSDSTDFGKAVDQFLEIYQSSRSGHDGPRSEMRLERLKKNQIPILVSRRVMRGSVSRTASSSEVTLTSKTPNRSLTSTISSQSVPTRSETIMSSVLKPSIKVPTSVAENDLPFVMAANLLLRMNFVDPQFVQFLATGGSP